MNENKHDHSDEELIRLAANGDVDSYGCIYERYLESIYRYIYYRISDVQDAEDLTEDVFLRVWNNLQTTSSASGIRNFKAWLYRIAHNLVVDYHRTNSHSKVEYLTEQYDFSNAESSAEELSIQRLGEQELELAIRGLEDPLQQIVIMRFIIRMSHAETASVLGLKEGHVRVLQYRALKKLQKILEKDQADG